MRRKKLLSLLILGCWFVCGAQAQINCNFEKDFCGWTQSQTDAKLKWQRNSGKTPTPETGPSGDHSENGAGYYIYMQASQGSYEDKAKLQSPVINSLQNCFTFWYHMSGEHIGLLRINKISGNSSIVAWSRNGNQGNVWKMGRISLAAGTYYLVLEAEKNGYKGDIAVDDISMVQGYCNAIAEEDYFFCDFEGEQICNFTHLNYNFFWKKQSGETDTYETGPSFDHSTESALGSYMYIDASPPRRKGHKARIISPIFKANGADWCLQFYYHMKGKDVGKLNVYVQDQAVGILKWSKDSEASDKWETAELTVTAIKTLQFCSSFIPHSLNYSLLSVYKQQIMIQQTTTWRSCSINYIITEDITYFTYDISTVITPTNHEGFIWQPKRSKKIATARYK